MSADDMIVEGCMEAVNEMYGLRGVDIELLVARTQKLVDMALRDAWNLAQEEEE